MLFSRDPLTDPLTDCPYGAYARPSYGTILHVVALHNCRFENISGEISRADRGKFRAPSFSVVHVIDRAPSCRCVGNHLDREICLFHRTSRSRIAFLTPRLTRRSTNVIFSSSPDNRFFQPRGKPMHGGNLSRRSLLVKTRTSYKIKSSTTRRGRASPENTSRARARDTPGRRLSIVLELRVQRKLTLFRSVRAATSTSGLSRLRHRARGAAPRRPLPRRRQLHLPAYVLAPTTPRSLRALVRLPARRRRRVRRRRHALPPRGALTLAPRPPPLLGFFRGVEQPQHAQEHPSVLLAVHGRDGQPVRELGPVLPVIRELRLRARALMVVPYEGTSGWS